MAQSHVGSLIGLPRELILLICDYLSPLSRVQLALTCRITFHLFCVAFSKESLRDLEYEDKLSLLLSLEQDDPKLIYCADCIRLRTLQYDDHSSTRWHDMVQHIQCSGQYRGMQICCLHQYTWEPVVSYKKERQMKYAWCDAWRVVPSGLVVTFFEAHAVMHRHFHGEPYGLPIEGLKKSFCFQRWLPASDKHRFACNHWPLEAHSLKKQPLTRALHQRLSDESRHLTPESSFKFRRRHSARTVVRALRTKHKAPRPGFSSSQTLIPWNFEHHFNAAIIEDELYLRRTHRVSCTVPAEEEIPLGSIDRFRLPICEHVRTFKGPRDRLGPEETSRCATHRERPVDPDREDEGSTLLAPELNCLAEETSISHKALRSCGECYTDYRLIIDWGIDGRHSFELSTYHRLGQCRTVHERAWQSLGWRAAASSAADRREDREEFGLTAIYARWHRSRRESTKEMKGVLPHWTEFVVDLYYNPLLEAKYGFTPKMRWERKPRSKREASWFCDCRHYCTKYPGGYKKTRNSRLPSRWVDLVKRSKNITPEDYDNTVGDRDGLDRVRMATWGMERAIFLDEENEDKFGQPFMS